MPPSPQARAEDGFTVAEMAVAMLLLGIVLAVIFGALVSAGKVVATVDIRSQNNDQVRLAVQTIDRQVRSGNVLYDPSTEATADSGVAASYSMRIYTQANGSNKCVQWRVYQPTGTATSTLQMRSWTTSWQWDHQVTAWMPVATGILNGPGAGPVPFSLDPAAPYGNRVIDVDMVANVNAATIGSTQAEIKDSIAGRNTEYGFDPTVCNTVPAP